MANGNGNTEQLATRQKPAVLQAIEQAKPQFEGRLPANITAEKFMFGVATAVQKNPALLNCDTKSVLLAAYEAAELGVSLSPTLQLGYLIPYGNQAQFQISYRGMVQKAYETGAVASFFAEVVYENDRFERQLAPKRNIFHAPADGERGEPIGAYALVEFKDGHLEYEYLTSEQIARHRKHSKQPDSMMWKTFWEEGWRKTPIRVLAKRLPLTNPGMEKLAEVIERDAEKDAEATPAGALVLEEQSPLLAERSGRQAEEHRGNGNGNAASPAKREIFVQVGKQLTVVSGNTFLVKDELPKVGAKWEKEARVWSMPSARTHELLAVCEKKSITVTECDSNGKPMKRSADSAAAPEERQPGDDSFNQQEQEQETLPY